MRMDFISNGRNLLVSAAVLGIGALGCEVAQAQSGHDAFDKAQGFDNGREEQAAHNSLQRGEQYNSDQRRNSQSASDQRNSDDNETVRHHASLGVSLAESDGNVRVIAIMPGSPAARAGLRVGDEIRYVADQKIATAQGLAEEIGEYRPGSNVELAIRRDGEKQTINARLGSRDGMSRSRERWNENASSQGNGRRNDQSANVANRSAYSYGSNSGQSNDVAQLSQQVRNLQQQVGRLQQQLNELQSPQTGGRNQDGRSQDGRYRDNRRDSGQNGQQTRSQRVDQSDDLNND